MQTFLPYPDFEKSLRCLDQKRLGKQRVESFQILNALNTKGKWSNHPAVKMWKGYENALKDYYNKSLRIWKERGCKNIKLLPMVIMRTALAPPWLGDEAFHASHRSNLLRKDSDHYSQFGWTEGPDLPYVWPVFSSDKTINRRNKA